MAAINMRSDLKTVGETTGCRDATGSGFMREGACPGTDELSALAGKRLGHGYAAPSEKGKSPVLYQDFEANIVDSNIVCVVYAQDCFHHRCPGSNTVC